ncbi:osmoprotectant transport system permease protein [Deinobacterium chartae]|uniref:Osmoprotectant transport system permease protein n=1 Tax=Deinobacterium chartae TaxID=521158 RepID=A0A841HXG0_9DEIO|nr:ABC transporter permease [Deinobacterium chartae]MBB6096929.1 osmoprotectant transport system permease protein [Deinobacterium chartae]
MTAATLARRSPARRPLRYAAALLWTALLLTALFSPLLETLLRPLAPDPSRVLDPSGTLWELTLTHLYLVGLAGLLTVLAGVPLAVFVTRPGNAAFLELTQTLVGLGQTVPTLALLALAVPALGFGTGPALLGLWLYGLVPVVGNAVAGLRGVDPSITDAARGMGMTPAQVLLRVELPLALPVLLAGIRTSLVVNVGTATIGAALGAGGLGAPIINGLSAQNTAYVLEGAVASALLALWLDSLLELLAPPEAS